MTLLTPPGARSQWHRALVAAGGALCAVASNAQSLAPPAGTSGAGPGLVLVAYLISLGALAATAAWAVSLHRRQRRQAAELLEAQALREMLDVWQWQTDTVHALVALRPPQGAANDQWGQPRAHPLLWQHFETDSDALRASLAAKAPFTDVHAQHGGRHFLLRGAPRFDADGHFSHYVGTAREQPATLDALAAPLLQALPSPALQVCGDGAQAAWRVQAGNAAAAKWLGVAESRLAHMAWADVQSQLPASARPALAAVTSLQQPANTAMADGWELRVTPLAPAPGNTHRSAWLVFHRPAAAALDANRAHDLEAFSYTVSHDLRAPIRVVEGFAKILKEDYGRQLDRIGNDHLDRVLGAATRMNSMIDSLLALSQLSAQPLARQPINLSQLVGYIVDDLRRQSPERHVRVEIAPHLQANGDATLMRVALENLLSNAWKYTGKRKDACIWFERSEHEGRTAFTVRDNGAGFDMRFADRLFGVFQRLHSASDFQGTGVGLASVRRIMRRHGGDIYAEADVGKGARFQFWI